MGGRLPADSKQTETKRKAILPQMKTEQNSMLKDRHDVAQMENNRTDGKQTSECPKVQQ